MASSYSNRWGLVLAGGDGSRLKSFTKRIAGYELPKQFCPILSSKPLLRETLDRVSQVVAPSRTLISVNREHRRYYSPMFQGAPELLVEEPRNRGTAPAILHALMRLYELAPSAIVGLFPSDHYIGNEARFVKYADSAFDAAADSDDAVILLGAEAGGPEQAYGWIEPETSLASAARLFSVRRFVEKPDARLANELWRGGALWNTFVLVARVSALLRMFIVTMPRLYGSLSDVRPALGTVFEADVLARLYDQLPISGFSELIPAAMGRESAGHADARCRMVRSWRARASNAGREADRSLSPVGGRVISFNRLSAASARGESGNRDRTVCACALEKGIAPPINEDTAAATRGFARRFRRSRSGRSHILSGERQF